MKPEGTFTLEEYLADTARVVEYAERYGKAVVVNLDGTTHVVISVPAPDTTSEISYLEEKIR